MLEELIIKELDEIGIQGFSEKNIEPFYHKDGISLFRIKGNGDSFILKYFLNHSHANEIMNYRILQQLQIPTIKVLGQTSQSLLLEDLRNSREYRLAEESDIEIEETGYAVAQWYKKLHSKGEQFLKDNKQNTHLIREIDTLTHENLLILRDKTDTKNDSIWTIIFNHIDRVKERIAQMSETITYNDFYWGNLALHRGMPSIKEAMIFDYNLMGIGLRYNDIRNVTISLNGKAVSAFYEAYGKFDEREIIYDKPLSTLAGLVSAFQRDQFPKWGMSLLETLNNGELEKDFRALLEVI